MNGNARREREAKPVLEEYEKAREPALSQYEKARIFALDKYLKRIKEIEAMK